jgi:hypothetical protein
MVLVSDKNHTNQEKPIATPRRDQTRFLPFLDPDNQDNVLNWDVSCDKRDSRGIRIIGLASSILLV